jgi:hypothetical protein
VEGSRLRGAPAGATPRLHRGARAHARARHRGEHGGVQRRERGAAAPAAVSGTRSARGRLRPVPEHGLDGVSGVGPRVPGLSGPEPVVRASGCLRHARQLDHGRRRGGARAVHRRELADVSGARRGARARPRVRRGRRSAGRGGRRRAEPRALAASLRRRSRRDRPDADLERHARDDHRRHAGGLPLPGGRRPALGASRARPRESRRPGEPLPVDGRPAPFGSEHRIGAGGGARSDAALGRRPCDHALVGRREPSAAHPLAPRADRGRCDASALGDAGGGGRRSAHCLCQRGQPAAGTRRGARA